MTIQYRQKLVAFVTFFSGLYFFLEFLLPEKIVPRYLGLPIGDFKFGEYNEAILQGVQVVGVMAIGLGLINILRVHGGRLGRMQRGWENSLALLSGMIVMFYVQGSEFVASQNNLGNWKPIGELQAFLQKINKEYKDKPTQAADATLLIARTINTAGENLIAKSEAPNIVADEKFKRTKENFQLQLNIAKEKTELLRGTYAKQSTASSDEEKAALAAGAASAFGELGSQLKLLSGSARDLSAQIFEQLPTHLASHFMYQGLFVSLGAAMFALLAFYIANAAYRSFRVKSVEASVMMLTAVIVILGQIPYGPIYISDKLPMARLWLLQNINTPGNRAIYFGATIAALAMAIRMWFSLEKNPLALDQDESAVED